MPAPPGERTARLIDSEPDASAGLLPGPELAVAAAARSQEVVGALARLTDGELEAPSLLRGWSRLTVACHLRFGARTLLDMTAAAGAGRETSYYPGGRDRQRPGTLVPEPGESPGQVVASLAQAAADLDAVWADVSPGAWVTTVREPPGNPDLGTVPLGHLPMSRLTEVEVHGLDLALGLDDYSAVFVDLALPYRLWRLRSRTPATLAASHGLSEGTWLLVATDGPSYRVTVSGLVVETAAGVESALDDVANAGIIEGSSRDLLAVLLGRPVTGAVSFGGDVARAEAFSSVFPGP